MIIRSHVCLRCQLRLIRRSSPAQLRFTHQSTQPEAPLIPPREREERSEELNVTNHSEYVDNGTNRPIVPVKNGKISKHPLGKLYGHLGQMQRENRERLGEISALGDPAEVIVLRDSRVNAYMGGLKEIAPEEFESIDIVETLKKEAEQKLVGQKEVEDNLNQFRPEEGQHPKDLREFDDLVQKIQAGFTGSQLARYIEDFRAIPLPKVRSERSNAIQGISSWIPDVSPLENRDPIDEDPIRGYNYSSYTAKHRLAVRLMRECWMLAVPEVEEGIGEVEVLIHPTRYEYLLSEQGRKQSLLREIFGQFTSSEEESFVTFHERHTIRLITTRAASAIIIEDLDNKLKWFRQLSVDARFLAPDTIHTKRGKNNWVQKTFPDELRVELSRLTKTSVSLSTQKVVISSVGPIWHPLTSDSLDIAYRLLILSANIPNRVRPWLGYRATPEASKGVFIKFQPNPGFSWWERCREWWRWVDPITKEGNVLKISGLTAQPSLKSSTEIDGSNITPVDIELPEETPMVTETYDPRHSIRKRAVYWSPKYISQSSALIGTILHSVSPSSASTLHALAPADLFVKADQKFDTAAPNFSHLINSRDARKVHDPVQSIIMRLIPDPLDNGGDKREESGSKVLAAYPSIEMHFSIDPTTKDAKIREIQAVVSTENSDLMLPDSSVDVRFEQNTRSKLRGRSGDEYPKSIQDFINNSNLNIENARYLETPPRVKIPIDRHLCQNPTSIDLNKNDDIHEVNYMFAGLEIHNTAAMVFDDWVMTYTSIQAGKANGRRSEIRLRPTAMKDSTVARSEKDFTRSVFRLIEALDTSKVPPTITKYEPSAERHLARHFLSSGVSSKHRLRSLKASRDGVVRFLAKRIAIRTEIESSQETQRSKTQHAFWELQEGVASEPIIGSDDEEDEFLQEIMDPKYDTKPNKWMLKTTVWKPGMKIRTKAHIEARDKYCDDNKLCNVCFSPAHSSFGCPNRKRRVKQQIPETARIVAKEEGVPVA